jgi:Flp pilus assembly CpaE family ATPase
VSRQTVVVALPPDESRAVSSELTQADFETISISSPDQLDALLSSGRDIAVAILDGEYDFDVSLEYYALLHDAGRSIPALMVLSDRSLDRLSGAATGNSIHDEYFTRPYSADSLRWRVEAMLIRSQTVDDGSGNPIIETSRFDTAGWTKRAQIVAIFNPKGGVGKTTIAMNLAATLQARHGQQVLLVDADTVTGHVTMSLGMEQIRTVVDAWREQADGDVGASFQELATEHASGMRVVSLTSTPLHTEILEPARVVEALTACRRGFDAIVIDLHPSYSELNLAMFALADRILVPVTPDVPALRAAVQLRDVAVELGLRDRLAMIVNRANSGVSVADMERTVGMPALALIRSGGLLFVRAANEGRAVVERFPNEKVSDDFAVLAERLLGPNAKTPVPARAPLRNIFGRVKVPVRA